ncbi:hypothetical protein, partial [Pseudomonas sp. PvR086]
MGGGTAAVALKAMLNDPKNSDDRFIARLRLTTNTSDLSERDEFLPFATGCKRPILLKKSDFQLARTQARSPAENLLTTLSGFS